MHQGQQGQAIHQSGEVRALKNLAHTQPSLYRLVNG
jgi:hypothetical protein